MLRFAPLQRRLEHIYQISGGYSVDDFITSDAEFVARFDGGRGRDEKLLLREQNDGFELSLYLDAELIERLSADDPSARLHEGNWVDFCTALEGVSHFLYLICHGGRRGVTPLELEMQAEVDKFVVCVSLFAGQRGAVPRRLHPRLFEQFALAADLDQTERERYRDANRYAGKYCRGLERRYLRRQDRTARRGRSLLGELRQFYRLSLRQKIGRIERLRG